MKTMYKFKMIKCDCNGKPNCHNCYGKGYTKLIDENTIKNHANIKNIHANKKNIKKN